MKEAEYLTAKEICELLKISDSTLRRWVRDEMIPYAKIGKQLRFRRETIDQWIAEREVAVKSAQG